MNYGYLNLGAGEVFFSSPFFFCDIYIGVVKERLDSCNDTTM